MKILITGATGFIGKHLIDSLTKSHYSIFIITRKNSNTTSINKKVTILKYDEDITNLESFFKEYKFDGIIHLASIFLSEHNKEDINNLINSNITFGTQLLEMSKKHKVKWFINTGTFWQHYKNEEYNPVNLYAATKEAFIDIAKYYTETSNLIFTTIKLNDTFGPNDTRKKIFNIWKEISENNQTLKMSKGEQLIDICFIEDIINAYEILIKHLNSRRANSFRNKIFVVSSNEKTSLKELAKLFEKTTQKKLNILWGEKEYRKREVMVPYNNGKVIPNWKPKFSLEEAILKTVGIKND